MRKGGALLVPLGFALGCASATFSPGQDLAGSGGGDLAGRDLGGRDLAQAADLAMGGGDLAGTGDLAGGGDQSMLADLAVPGLPAGQNCTMDADCQSQLCKDVVKGGSSKVCVAQCTSQNDCTNFLNLFCEPITAGSPAGYCIPRSPSHCSSCQQDSDCGSLAERCIQGPGDISTACHIDCALAGAAACPGDYTCAKVTDGAQMRMLCIPTVGTCLDNLGGWCDRTGLPQSCARTNMAGTCVGQRACLNPAQRYDKCGAMSPQYKMTCQDLDPAGCTEQFAPGATNTPQNCGACGNACPGLNTGNSDAQCTDPMNKTCGLTCRDDNYDVDKSPNNGCEVADTDPAGHDKNSAGNFGDKDCDSGNFANITGHIDSDSRVHQNPAVNMFNAQTGSAPDYWAVHATGGLFCVNDYSGTFTTAGGGGAACYNLQVVTDKNQNISITNTGAQSQGFNSPGGSSQYSDGSTIYFIVTKTCNLPVQEAVSYTINFHL